MAFINGKPDPWGMKVNPQLQEGRSCRRAEWPLLDDFVPPTEQRVPAEQPVDLLQPAGRTGHHPAQDRRRAPRRAGPTCRPGATPTPAPAPVQARPRSTGSRRHPVHARASSASATPARYGPARRRRWRPRRAPTSPRRTRRWRRGADARPAEGRPAVHPRPGRRPQVPHGLPGHDGRLHGRAAAEPGPRTTPPRWPQFIRVSTSEGQRAGQRQRPAARGFLPIQKTGVTAPLYASARSVADRHRAQQKRAAATPRRRRRTRHRRRRRRHGGATVTPPDDRTRQTTSPADGADAVGGRRRPTPRPSPAMPATSAVGSAVAERILPLLILLGGADRLSSPPT